MLLIDWANKVNYAVDALVIGVFLNTGAVALWSVSQRLAETTQRLTNQLNDVLFPNVVDNERASRSGSSAEDLSRRHAVVARDGRSACRHADPAGAAAVARVGR